MAVQTYTKSGTKATTPAKLDKAVFGLKVTNHELLKQAYVAYLSNGRSAHAKTKTRGEVIGSNIKPWKQKGTGRARFGSKYNPIWRGGGITFGPTGEENFTQKLSVAAKRQAIRQALSLAADANKLVVLETFESKEGKVAPVIKLLDKIGTTGNVLLVVSLKDDLIVRSTSNITYVQAVQAKYLNVFDVLNADSIVISQPALEMVHDWLKPSSKPATTKGVTK